MNLSCVHGEVLRAYRVREDQNRVRDQNWQAIATISYGLIEPLGIKLSFFGHLIINYRPI
jgi:hypothetical protein